MLKNYLPPRIRYDPRQSQRDHESLTEMWGFYRLSWDENRSAGRVRTISRQHMVCGVSETQTLRNPML